MQEPRTDDSVIEELKVFLHHVKVLHAEIYVLSGVWADLSQEAVDIIHSPRINNYYPFTSRPMSFDELTSTYKTWSESIEEEINFREWQNTRRPVLELNDLRNELGVGDGDITGPGYVYRNSAFIRRIPYSNVNANKTPYHVEIGGKEHYFATLEQAERHLWAHWAWYNTPV